MDQGVPRKKDRQTQMYWTTPFKMCCTPPEAKSHDKVDDTEITDQVRVE
jgi:hypothetical protein